jgi:osmotically-inducible protein OsmY
LQKTKKGDQVFNFFNKTDAEVKRDVINELNWDPSLSAKDVLVTAADGIVTLHGNVPHYFEKSMAEKAAQRVGGVKAVADELEVKGIFDKTDEEISEAAINALKWNYAVPSNIKISVEKGWITLRGETDWEYQRSAAKSAVSELLGVTGVSNSITIRSQVQPSDIKSRIEEALKRSAESEGKKIDVTVNGDKVTLSGKVHSYAESSDAKNAAWMAPGVSTVENRLTISQF